MSKPNCVRCGHAYVFHQYKNAKCTAREHQCPCKGYKEKW